MKCLRYILIGTVIFPLGVAGMMAVVILPTFVADLLGVNQLWGLPVTCMICGAVGGAEYYRTINR